MRSSSHRERPVSSEPGRELLDDPVAEHVRHASPPAKLTIASRVHVMRCSHNLRMPSWKRCCLAVTAERGAPLAEVPADPTRTAAPSGTVMAIAAAGPRRANERE